MEGRAAADCDAILSEEDALGVVASDTVVGNLSEVVNWVAGVVVVSVEAALSGSISSSHEKSSSGPCCEACMSAGIDNRTN